MTDGHDGGEAASPVHGASPHGGPQTEPQTEPGSGPQTEPHAAPDAAPTAAATPAPTPADVLAESTRRAVEPNTAPLGFVSSTAADGDAPELVESIDSEESVESAESVDGAALPGAARRRRRGSRDGRNRSGRSRVASDDAVTDAATPSNEADDGAQSADGEGGADGGPTSDGSVAAAPATEIAPVGGVNPELPDPPLEGKVADPVVAAEVLVRRPRIGDTRPAPPMPPVAAPGPAARGRTSGAPSGLGAPSGESVDGVKKRRRGGRGRGQGGTSAGSPAGSPAGVSARPGPGGSAGARGAAGGGPGASAGSGGGGARRGGRAARATTRPGESFAPSAPIALDADALERRRGRERNGRPVGRYTMCVHVRPELTQVAVLEGRSLIEHFVSRPSDDVAQIHGNIYVGKVQNVLPGMEAAFIDIATPKNAVLYRGDITYDAEDVESGGRTRGAELRIEQMLRPKQLIVCQVTKNPIGAKGARLTQEVSLPGRFVVLIPNSKTYGISKRLPDEERRRLRTILDRVKPAEHGVIVRTAAENVVAEELRADVERLLREWQQVEALAKRTNVPKLVYREPDLAVRVIREEFNNEYRRVVIDDRALYEEVRDYVASINPTLADRVEYYDASTEGLPLFEEFHVHEQVHKALDRKVWLPSGGSLIIEHTEALTVIDVNTGKNVGTTNLEETVFRNNLEAADEIARQLRLRDIGGIIVIDFIDMEIKENRQKVIVAFREALSRDKTRSQVFEISELGLVEMTRKRIGEGLLTAFTEQCPVCEGRGVKVDHTLID